MSTTPEVRPMIALSRNMFRRRGISRGRSVSILGRVWAHGRGTIEIGDDVVLDARAAPIELHAGPGAVIAIGRGARIEAGASLEAMSRITVGPHAKLGPFSKVMDNNFHPLDGEGRLPPSRPVAVGEGAEVGARAILLPGARIGRGAIVPAGAVVSRRFGVAPGEMELLPEREESTVGGIRPPVTAGALGKMRGAIEIVRSAWYLRGCQRGRHVHVGGPMLIANAGRVSVGDHAVFLGGMIPTAITCSSDGSIEIGPSTIFNYGASLNAHRSIQVGSRCRFGSLVRISDHGNGRVGPVNIGDDVWIAHGATIEAGVKVGSGSIVSAGSTVTSDVPPGSLAIGNPARCMSLSLVSELSAAARSPMKEPR